MPLIAGAIPPPPDQMPRRKRWTRSECAFLRDNGLLTDRYELIEGEVIDKMGQKPSHRSAVLRLRNWLIRVFGATSVQSQSPIDVTDADNEINEPEPDVAVTTLSDDAYQNRNPGPDDLLLAAEVSDTTLRYDLTVKAALYARAAIREYWVVDVSGRRLYIHRQPSDGAYADIQVYEESEAAATLARPESFVIVADLLPPIG